MLPALVVAVLFVCGCQASCGSDVLEEASSPLTLRTPSEFEWLYLTRCFRCSVTVPKVPPRAKLCAARRGPAGLQGGIISSSRPILFPTTFSDAGSGDWEKDVRDALAKATNERGEAVV